MARTVGELPISDQYAVVPASTRLNEAIDLMSKPTVEILLVEDPEVKRIVGVLTEQHILRILASGATRHARSRHPHVAQQEERAVSCG